MFSLKRLLFLLACLTPLLPVLGWWLDFHWLAPLVFYFGVWTLDSLLGRDTHNPDPDAQQALAADRFYRVLTLAYVPFYLGVWLWSLAASTALSGWDWLGFALSMGIVGGFSINVAHELGHKNDWLSQRLANTLLLTVAYAHFTIEHNRGHHVKVATEDDPASARLNESYYHFLGRSVIGGWRHAWALEAERLLAQGLTKWHWRNAMLWFTALPPLLALAIGLAWGVAAAGFYVLVAAFAVIHLELQNYIAHYGLRRQRLASGRYERPAPQHAWNDNHRLSNALLFQLPRHADHHARPTLPYQLLRDEPASPQLPASYPPLFLAALVPPLYRRLIHPRLPDSHSPAQ